MNYFLLALLQLPAKLFLASNQKQVCNELDQLPSLDHKMSLERGVFRSLLAAPPPLCSRVLDLVDSLPTACLLGLSPGLFLELILQLGLGCQLSQTPLA